MALTVKYSNRKTGAGAYVYHVSGPKSELEQYKEDQGDNYREDEKNGNKPCFFTKKLAQTGTLEFLEEHEKYVLRPDFQSELMISIAREMLGQGSSRPDASSKATEDEDLEEQKPARSSAKKEADLDPKANAPRRVTKKS